MIVCKKCGSKLIGNEIFCPNCGLEQKKDDIQQNLSNSSNKLIFESKGGNKTREIISIIFGTIFVIASLFLFYSLLGDKGGMSHSGYGGTWVYRDAPDTVDYLSVIIALGIGTFLVSVGIVSKKSFLRIYEDHLEAKAFDFYKGNSNIILNYSEIQGVSIQKGMIVIETLGNTKKIYCSDCKTAEKILFNQLKYYKK